MKKNLGFVFPGQGSQSIGMLKALTNEFFIVEKTFKEASEALGYDLWQLVQQGPEEKLNKTEFTQPALLAAGVSVWRVWLHQNGPLPQLLAGHSLGEYAALVCAEALNFSDAIKLVEKRGRFMQQAVPEGTGAMAAIIGLEPEDIEKICETAREDQVLAPANFNATGQIVIAGHKAAVERAIEAAKAKGAKIAKLLPVSVPSHCLLMEPAAKQLERELEGITISAPKIPVIQNADVKEHKHPDDIRHALVRQLYLPVRWIETMQRYYQEGIQKAVECGPGKVLVGLGKRTIPDISFLAVFDPDTLRQALQEIGD